MTDTLAPASPPAPTDGLPTPSSTRWRPLRAGLQNVWQYDHATRFTFHGGRLLLRGRNGVGKTKVVEVLLPFLLEGRMQPSRLDPFGSRSRRMHYNLLHDGNADAQSAIGYVWLEFGRLGRDGSPEYATIGAGLRARRSADAVESWFFTTTTRRVDRDLDLLADDLTPHTRPHLVEALGDDGQVLTTAGEYRAAVNRLLFGVPEPQYEAMVDALLRLRQPHLSERLEPDEVATVLADSLPPLDTTKVNEVAEGFERLEAHRRDLDDRRRSLAAVESFLDVYRDYAAVVAAVHARRLTRAEYQRDVAAAAVTAATEDHDEAVATVAALDGRGEEVTAGLAAARTRIETLQGSDAYRAVQDLEKAEGRQEDARQRARVADEAMRASTDDLADAETELDEATAALATQTEAVAAARRTAIRAAGEADLVDEHHGAVGGLAATVDAADDGTTDGAVVGSVATEVSAARGARDAVVEARRRGIAAVREATRAVTAAEDGLARAEDRLDQADESVARADEDAAAARESAEHAAETFSGRVVDWSRAATRAVLDEDALEAVLASAPEDAAATARDRTSAAREQLDRALAGARAHVVDIEQDRQELVVERGRLEAATHEPPPAPAWRTADRTDRPGAPFYLLAELTDALAPDEQANVEAALAAAGILDAWVLPDGTLLADHGFGDVLDVVVVEGDGAPGRTLADVCRIDATGELYETMASVLDRIAVRDPGEVRDDWLADGGTASVSTAGHFALGPIDGRVEGDVVRYLGAGARERERQRRLDELAAAIADLDAALVTARDAVADAEQARRTLDDELAAFPSSAAVLDARAEERAAARQLTAARDQRDAAADARDRAAATVREARDGRDRVATDAGLVAHVDRLDELAAATDAWWEATTTLFAVATTWGERRQRVARATDTRDRAGARAEADAVAAQTADAAVAELAAEVATLTEMIGADRDELLAELRDARTTRDRLAAEERDLGAQRLGAAEQVGVTRRDLAAAEQTRDRTVADRDTAADDLLAVVRLGITRHLDVELVGDVDTWGVTAALEHARAVLRIAPDLPEDDDDVLALSEREENTMARRQQELQRELVAGIRLLPRRTHGVLVYDVQESGRTSQLGELAAELRQEVAERDARLRDDEQDLLEAFLTGELHEHLRTRIRDAGELVDVMNDQLAACPTTAGHRVRLRWGVAEDAPPGTGEAIELLLRGRSLITDDQRRDLRAFLHERLREAREGESAASLFERIAATFDYRRWYAFTVEVREGDAGTWRRLTRQSHGAGSGGEKAVMLHLPLFAAMAAHYHGSPSSPRLIVLDEVFAGIDRETRGQLMGLLVELDLDALLTSHDEWGFYAELDGLSTYHLVREPGVPGVLGEWFLWDGSARWEMGS